MKTTALADRYIRSEDFASHIDGVQLAPEVWAVFAQLHQARTTAEMAATLDQQLACFRTEDFAEGVRAPAERRAPRFTA